MAPSPQSPPTIPLLFRIFFLYFEPFAAIYGALQALFVPISIASISLPTGTPVSLDPFHQFLFTCVAGLWLHFGLIEAVVLRLTSNLKIWSAVIGSMFFSDLAHLYAPQRVVSECDVYWRADRWRWEDWVNLGTSNVGFMMKIAFLVWVGLVGGRGRTVEEVKKHEE